MKLGRYNIKDLLCNDSYDQIVIPEIQRDYVWQEQNVKSLLNSVFLHYKQKKNLVLDIKCDSKPLPEDLCQYLNAEYRRLRFNTRIGFIYAYSDLTYPDKLFLIDGQQRLTTLSLLLLAAYCSGSATPEMREAYKRNYFIGNQPRLDYKVREVTHDFLVSFISHVTGGRDIEQSGEYYVVFQRDLTARMMLHNYKCIVSLLEEEDILADRESFIDYVEHYIEFNYFDTKLSRQGERLYLYMNSRGEDLSEQENVKAMLIARSVEKLADGEHWEDWQNFFWQHRGENANADIGFRSFLKMASIIHICTQDQSTLASSSREKKEPYISALDNADELERQNSLRLQYLTENKSFTVEWLHKVFDALKRLSDIHGISCGYIRQNWLSEIKSTIEYVTVLGCIYYLMRFHDASEKDVDRLGMHLKNICFYDTNRKNPNSTVIVVLDAIKKLCDNDVSDIADERVSDFISNSRFYSKSDEMLTHLYRSGCRDEWEQVFWEAVNHDQNRFDNFLQGDLVILFKLCEDERPTPETLRHTFNVFDEKIYSVRKENTLRRQLLLAGDYSLWDGGSSNTGDYMERWNLIENDDDWHELLTSGDLQIIKNYLYNPTPDNSFPHRSWKNILAVSGYGCFEYMGQNKFLWHDGMREDLPHIVLLNGNNASEWNSRELAVQILNAILPLKHWIWNRNTCVIEFDVTDSQCQMGTRGDKNYYLDIIFDWNAGKPHWHLRLGHRTKALESSEILERLCDTTGESWTDNEAGKFVVEIFYEYSNRDSDETASIALSDKIKELLPKICSVLG